MKLLNPCYNLTASRLACGYWVSETFDQMHCCGRNNTKQVQGFVYQRAWLQDRCPRDLFLGHRNWLFAMQPAPSSLSTVGKLLTLAIPVIAEMFLFHLTGLRLRALLSRQSSMGNI